MKCEICGKEFEHGIYDAIKHGEECFVKTGKQGVSNKDFEELLKIFKNKDRGTD